MTKIPSKIQQCLQFENIDEKDIRNNTMIPMYLEDRLLVTVTLQVYWLLKSYYQNLLLSKGTVVWDYYLKSTNAKKDYLEITNEDNVRAWAQLLQRYSNLAPDTRIIWDTSSNMMRSYCSERTSCMKFNWQDSNWVTFLILTIS